VFDEAGGYFVTEHLNRDKKKGIIKDIILKLHAGLSVESARDRFEEEVGTASSTEIAEIEQELINEGLSPEEIKKFCNVHALIFQAALEKAPTQETSPSHPVFLFKMENREIENIVTSLKKAIDEDQRFSIRKKTLKELLTRLKGIVTHYERKEQLLFPFLEKQGFMGPSKVMWEKDNEIRGLLKKALSELDDIDNMVMLANYNKDALTPLLEEVLGMIFKEENILFPTSLEKLDASDWVEILRESDDIGYVFIQKPEETAVLEKHLQDSLIEETLFQDNNVSLPTGAIGLDELMYMLNTLPIDITFVDKDDTVRYFTDSQDRIFSRTKAIIGRKVQNCHPPQSVDVVEKILTSFKEGTKNFYDVRDRKDQYLGTLEVTQDITNIKELVGEKRLLDERD
jgi:DUF438 domain-containing protein